MTLQVALASDADIDCRGPCFRRGFGRIADLHSKFGTLFDGRRDGLVFLAVVRNVEPRVTIVLSGVSACETKLANRVTEDFWRIATPKK